VTGEDRRLLELVVDLEGIVAKAARRSVRARERDLVEGPEPLLLAEEGRSELFDRAGSLLAGGVPTWTARSTWRSLESGRSTARGNKSMVPGRGDRRARRPVKV